MRACVCVRNAFTTVLSVLHAKNNLEIIENMKLKSSYGQLDELRRNCMQIALNSEWNFQMLGKCFDIEIKLS